MTICPTPLGNLSDITLRQMICLRKSHVLAVENKSHTGKLINVLRDKD